MYKIIKKSFLYEKYSYLRDRIDEAKKSKSDRIFVLTKDFNIKQNKAECWLNLQDYNYECGFDLDDFKKSYALGAVDLAETTDLCSSKILVMRNGDPVKYVFSHYFIPEIKIEENV